MGAGFNIVLPTPIPLDLDASRKLKLHLNLDGIGETVSSTEVYVIGAREVLPKLTKYTTFFPGDVFTFGRICRRIAVSRALWEKVTSGTGWIEHVCEVRFELMPDVIGGST